MHFHHLHFYVDNLSFWQRWFCDKLAFHVLQSSRSPMVLKQGGIEIWLSAPEELGTHELNTHGLNTHGTEVNQYLQQHPPGIVDIAFATENFNTALAQARCHGAHQLTPITTDQQGNRQCQLQGWRHLRHTLVEVSAHWVQAHRQPLSHPTHQQDWLSVIDHVVINVPKGELAIATDWYQNAFGLTPSQTFEITTEHSGLNSQVLVHPEGTLQLPINEPTSDNSQIQEFLQHNRGAGVQHVALRSRDAVGAIARFRQQGLSLLSVPNTYYDNLPNRIDCPLQDFSAIQQQQLLIDWPQGGDKGMLLQTFTQPIFAEPTFFFEIIERSHYRENGQLKSTQGFGEGNFQALFEAIERAQMKRGALT